MSIFEWRLHQDGLSHGQKVLYIKWSPGRDLFYAKKSKLIGWISRKLTGGVGNVSKTVIFWQFQVI